MLSGLPMGSHIAPIIAARVIYNLLTTIIPDLKFHILFFKIFVDDSIVAIPKNKLHILLQKLNSYNKNLQFTYKTENENRCINFLDVTIQVDNNNKLKFKWFRKLAGRLGITSSGRFLNFNSYCSLNYKLNTVKYMTYRIRHLSSPDFINSDIHFINYNSQIITLLI